MQTHLDHIELRKKIHQTLICEYKAASNSKIRKCFVMRTESRNVVNTFISLALQSYVNIPKSKTVVLSPWILYLFDIFE